MSFRYALITTIEDANHCDFFMLIGWKHEREKNGRMLGEIIVSTIMCSYIHRYF